MPHQELDRETLYEAVWATPMVRLAKQYGLSDVALKKICNKLEVPTPPRGHWARLRNGHAVKKPPLPPTSPGSAVTHTITSRSDGQNHDVQLPAQLQNLHNPSVPASLRNPDPLIEATREILANPRNAYRNEKLSESKLDALHVHNDTLPRALRIVNTILKEARRLGYDVLPRSQDRHSHSYLVIDGERVPFSLREKTRREEAKQDPDRTFVYPRYEYHHTGMLELRVGESYSRSGGSRRTWRDGKTQRVEDFLANFLVAAYVESQAMKRRREEMERREREWQLEWETRRERERQREAEDKRRIRLEEQADGWHKSRQIRSFIEEVERVASETTIDEENRQELDKWVRWAREHADRLDPLSRGLPPYEEPAVQTWPRRIM